MIEELKQIEKKYGELRPEYVVEEAKDKNHPLHNYFDWNNKVAGHKWRVYQARNLILRVKIEHPQRPSEKVRYYVHNGKSDETRKYQNIDRLHLQTDELQRTLDLFKRDVMSYTHRLRKLAGYKEYYPELDAKVDQIERLCQETVELCNESDQIEIEEV